MVSSVPSDKAHQGWSGRCNWLKVVSSSAFATTSQVFCRTRRLHPSCNGLQRPATARHDEQRTPMSLPHRARRTGARPDRRRGSQAASSNSSCRSIRAGAIGGARDGKPTPARYLRTEAPSVRAAIIFIVPPQAGHTVTSIWNTRASSRAHSTRWRPARVVGRATAAVRRRRQRTGARYDLGPIR